MLGGSPRANKQTRRDLEYERLDLKMLKPKGENFWKLFEVIFWALEFCVSLLLLVDMITRTKKYIWLTLLYYYRKGWKE
jgi:hypothetical protein